ncbi:hypothetical protein [Bradyrhizobium sp. BWC-3-1]|uniref:hypothetical protein n=1 Tax=Bradyrhizobium sp. BWC-3-1 TaxID=3080012 RepID=UPI00293E85D5|nr:hypothetical protein [Bradyrhizobium sp. BWC-3-1]WOH55596.1 hypothetical protein RX329_25245 [Bradyrhizobium sp. BWC-3-1]
MGPVESLKSVTLEAPLVMAALPPVAKLANSRLPLLMMVALPPVLVSANCSPLLLMMVALPAVLASRKSNPPPLVMAALPAVLLLAKLMVLLKLLVMVALPQRVLHALKFCGGPLNYVVTQRESVFPVTAPNIASHEGSENYLERWFAAIYERRRIDSADRFAIQQRRQSHDRHIGSGWECAPSLLETCPQMIQAAACTMRNAAATASSQPVSLWAWDRAANLVCVALLVTILVLRTFFGFVSEQMLTLAYDAARQAAPRRMQCRDDESDDAVLF